jgi:hypothetical protein
MALTPQEEQELAALEAELGNSVMAPGYQPPGVFQQLKQATIQSLPELGGMAGGALGFLGTRSPAGAELGSVLGSAAIRSMVGAGLGGMTGEAGQQAITGRPSVGSLLRSGVEQAIYDGAGNLLFTYAGKGYRIAKDQVSALIGKDAPESAVRAAQELLQQQKTGASLTQFQANPTTVNTLSESVARSSFGGRSLFVQAEKNVAKAIQSAKNNILDDVSKNIYDAVQTGEDFAKAIAAGDTALKDTVRPFYNTLDQGTNVLVSVDSIKQNSSETLLKAEKLQNLTLSAGERELLEDSSKLPKKITFSQAHDLLSSFKTKLRDAKKTSEPDTPKVQELTELVSSIEKAMDNAGSKLKGSALQFESKLAQDGIDNLFDQYKLYSNFYRESITELYADTTARILNKDPEFIGKVVYANGSVTSFKDAQKALARAKKLNPALNVEDTLNSVRRGYLENLLKSENSYATLGDKIKNDETIRRTFEAILDKDQQARVKTLLNASKFTQELPDTAAPLFFQAQQAGALVQAGTLGVGSIALLLSDDAKNVIAENPYWSAAGITTILLGPRFLAKAATNPEATNVTLGILSKVRSGEPIGKNLMLKTLQAWEQSGIAPVDIQEAAKPAPPVGLTPDEEAELLKLEAELGQ